MVKRKIKLSKVLEYKELLPKKIREVGEKINQLSKTKTKDDSQMLSLVEKLEQLSKQLIIVKEKVQEANKKKINFFDKTNEYYIYRLSEVKNQLQVLSAIKSSFVTTKVKNLLKEREVIEIKLDNFNKNLDVKIEIDPTLGLPE
jgi:chromosome segregation ATPase